MTPEDLAAAHVTIEHHPHGVVLLGAWPVALLSAVLRWAEEERGLDILDAMISDRLRVERPTVCAVLTSRKESIAWRQELEHAGEGRLDRDGAPAEEGAS